MATRSERNNFEKSGPRHLQKPDWSNPTHRRSIVASLVNAVYVLERNRQGNSQSPTDALDTPWCSFFKFHSAEHLVDKKDHSIFASVFENHDVADSSGAPAAVVAFRGTIFKPKTFTRDLGLITDGLHETSRLEQGLEAVRSRIARHGHRNVWLAGHSFGAALAMAAGKKICKEEGFQLECHLFSPPFPSAPVERIKNKELKISIHIGKTFLKAALAVMFADNDDPFDGLYEWIPNVYVNPSDYISSEYIGYFENRERMQNLGLGKITEKAATFSIISASHLIPSARLAVNRNPLSESVKAGCSISQQWKKFRMAHGIHQWWSPELQLECTQFTGKKRSE